MEYVAPQSVATPPVTEKAPAKPTKPKIPQPEDVAEQVWLDWLTLRKQKSAPVNETVIAAARREAVLAGYTFENFLREWCLRGSQGLKAEWLRQDRGKHPPFVADAKERNREAKRLLGFLEEEGEVIDV
jgi:hypothetical protein